MKTKAKVIIQYQGKLLLLKPLDKNKLTLIGGSTEKKERPELALIREAKEEANLELDPKQLNEKPCMFYCFLLEGQDIPFELREKEKFKYVDWIPAHEALERLKGIEKEMVLRYLNNPDATYDYHTLLTV
jgi:8-oxo-dGTP pyrophosphatase MutT (NUDIX family)